ncbi:WG repeat-containing protein [Flexithrix dorotheae]|uniref:WG repeat-containing protein n=1 Tax=Flexithrix dorotheae TaxID=70993 RepID=UPI0012F7F5B3|nr:WG repeat-containing protein [Flexithrix dorotheae]
MTIRFFMFRGLFLLIFLVFPLFLKAQSLRSVQNALDKQDFSKAKKLLEKIIEKDSTNAGGLYLYSIYFLHPYNDQGVEIDSSYKYVLSAISSYYALEEKEIIKLANVGITDRELTFQKSYIDSLGFAIADSLHTIESYQHYVDKFSTATQFNLATHKRDSLAFVDAEQTNTYETYYHFFTSYPNARQAEEAEIRYHKLLFQEKTKDGNLESYAQFIEDYPESPFRPDAENQFYRKFTADHKVATYEKFLEKYPDNAYADRAWKWLWFLTKDTDKESFLKIYPQIPDKDFINKHQVLDFTHFFLFYDDEKGLYGFMDQFGEILIDAQFDDIHPDYFCESVVEDFIIIRKEEKYGAIDKTGKSIAKIEFDKIEAFSPGVLIVEKEGKLGLINRTGYTILENEYEDIEYLNSSLIKVKRGEKWGLVAFNGVSLLGCEYFELRVDSGGVVAIKQMGKYAIKTEKELFSLAAQGKKTELSFKYDSYGVIQNEYLKLYADGYYSLWKIEGNKGIIEYALEIEETPAGWLVFKDNKFQIFDKEGKRITPVNFEKIVVNRKAYGIRLEKKWGVIDFKGNIFIQPKYDTLIFIGDRGILLFEDKKKLGYFYKDDFTDFTKYKSLNIQAVKVLNEDSVFADVPYIITEDRNGKMGLLSGDGKVLISNRYSSLALMPDGLVIVEQYKKRGLMNIEGKTVLKPQYDGIANFEEGYYSLLKSKKFGVYDLPHNSTIPPVYDGLLKFYGHSDSLYIAKKGKYGLIDRNNQVLADFQFDDLKHWNDTSVLVQHQGKWKIFDYIDKYFIPETFDTFDYLRQDEEETIITTFRASGYGLLSNKRGRLIPEEYSQIVNLGDMETPLYFVEKDVSQAGLYILLYIDKNGEVIKKQVLQEKDYEKIACYD